MSNPHRLLEVQDNELVQARSDGFILSTGGNDPVFSAYYAWLKTNNLPLVKIRRSQQHNRAYAHVEVNMVTTNMMLNPAGVAAIDKLLSSMESASQPGIDSVRSRTSELCCSDWIEMDKAQTLAAGLFILATDPSHLEPHRVHRLPHLDAPRRP